MKYFNLKFKTRTKPVFKVSLKFNGKGFRFFKHMVQSWSQGECKSWFESTRGTALRISNTSIVQVQKSRLTQLFCYHLYIYIINTCNPELSLFILCSHKGQRMIGKTKLIRVHDWKYWALTEMSGIMRFVTKWWEQGKQKSTKQQRRIYFVSSEMSVTHNILSQPVSPDKENLQSIIHPDSCRGHCSMRGLELGIAFYLLPNISLISLFFSLNLPNSTWEHERWNYGMVFAQPVRSRPCCTRSATQH